MFKSTETLETLLQLRNFKRPKHRKDGSDFDIFGRNRSRRRWLSFPKFSRRRIIFRQTGKQISLQCSRSPFDKIFDKNTVLEAIRIRMWGPSYLPFFSIFAAAAAGWGPSRWADRSRRAEAPGRRRRLQKLKKRCIGTTYN